MIDINKKYKTRQGEKVVLYCTDAPGKYPVHGRIEGLNGDVYTAGWTIEGHYLTTGCSDNDLVEVSPYDDFEIDEPVLVRNAKDCDMRCRHFAGVTSDGKPTTWDQGCTSWTGKSKTAWDYCIKAPKDADKS